MCLFGNLPFFFFFFFLFSFPSSSPPLKSRHGEIFILFPATIPKDLCPLGRGATEEEGRGRGNRQSRNRGEREGWLKEG